MKSIAVCVKETNDGYSSDFLYKSANFVNEGVVTDIRLSWISGFFDSSTNELCEKLKGVKPLKFVKLTKNYFYLVIVKLGQTSRWNDNVAVWCQIPLGVRPSEFEWETMVSSIERTLGVKETLAKKESWTFLDSFVDKSYECENLIVDIVEVSKLYACRFLTATETLMSYLRNYYQAGYQNFEAIVLLDEEQRNMVTCKSTVLDVTKNAFDDMIALQLHNNEDGWQPYNEKDDLLDTPILIGKKEQRSIFWKKSGCKTICKTGVGGDSQSFQITPNEYRKIMNKSSFTIRDEKGQKLSSFMVKVDGKDFRNEEIEFPIDYNMSKAQIDIALHGVEVVDGKKNLKKILMGVGGVVLGLVVGLLIGFSRTPKVVEVPVVQAVPFSCSKYFEENTNVWEKASMDSCEDLHGVFDKLAKYDFKGLQEHREEMEKYNGLRDLIAMVDKAVELGFQIDQSNYVTDGRIRVESYIGTLLTTYIESYKSWFKEELDVFDPQLFDALYLYDKNVVKKYVNADRPSLQAIWNDCYMTGKSHPQHYLNAEEINTEDYARSFTTVSAAPKVSKKVEPVAPKKDVTGQGADD